jgi:hypothetical protein
MWLNHSFPVRGSAAIKVTHYPLPNSSASSGPRNPSASQFPLNVPASQSDTPPGASRPSALHRHRQCIPSRKSHGRRPKDDGIGKVMHLRDSVRLFRLQGRLPERSFVPPRDDLLWALSFYSRDADNRNFDLRDGERSGPASRFCQGPIVTQTSNVSGSWHAAADHSIAARSIERVGFVARDGTAARRELFPNVTRW